MLNTHQEYGVTLRHIRCSSWDKRSTPYLVCIARFFFYSVETIETGVIVETRVTVETVETRVTEGTGVTRDTGEISIVMHDYVMTMLKNDVTRRKVTQRSTHYNALCQVAH